MGWFLCIAAPRGHAARATAPPARYATTFEADTDALRLVGGGAHRTFRARHVGDAVAVVSGIGTRVVEADEGEVTDLVSNDALLGFAAARDVPGDLGGGLAFLHHDGRTLWAASDGLGLRNLYAARLGPGALAVATHLDLLAPLLPSVRVDAQAFAGFVAGVHQMSHRALLAGVERLGPGGTARWDGHRLDVQTRHWTPDGLPRRPLSVAVRLRENGQRVPLSLGLSGGFDSRVMLGHLLDDRADLRLHTFGQAAHPDVQTALRIAGAVGMDITHVPPPEDDAERLADALDRWAVPTNGVTPASAASRFVYAAPEVIGTRLGVDGGFGEIGRGVFFKHFALALLRNPRADAARYLPYVTAPPPWMAADLGAPVADDLREALGALPRFRRAGVRAWMARFAIETLVPGTYGYAQDGYDLHAPMLMPCAAPAFLARVVVDGGGRRAGYTVRPDLQRIPLVKGTVVVPFSANLAVQTWRVRRAQRHPVPTMHRFAVAFLRRLEPLVRDWAAAPGLVASGLYDVAWLARAVEDFYGGDDRHASALDAWLSFEAFRRATGATR